ncbi:RagB/SusD family nutrient uptake outer membrane protein [Pedobacter sp. MC2016-14]|uniref:RagB/SusD family nutrient uptake outer membrane protein n=1 Tax=Pedobacter sp. MC2016-14 TaxID=2897327 RepID=UPI001E37C430|nr:RagB/SusD family nutrient uptake outer membrane protein [Pedobacter sp. MC2016-14]MCD0488385.1 RagB/SusD family nutrient uptake outer membrane protein [Pedobacter sp. MC2016-14]
MSKSIYTIMTGFLTLIMIISSGCEKIIDIDAPLNQVPSELVYASDKLATSARSGMFSGLALSTTQQQNLTVYSSLQADDLLYLATVLTQQEYNNNTYNLASSGQAGLFSDWYAIIYRANSVIEGLATSTGTSAQIRKQYTAEAKFIRAYCYFNLVNTFGDVPLVLETNSNVTAFLPKESTANIYAKIITDLTEAKADLLLDYSATASDRAGVNRYTAAALLARVYMFTGNYVAAEANASEVLAVVSPTSLYNLIPKANLGTGVFVKNSAETIWQMSPPLVATSQYTVEGSTFLPSGTTLSTFAYRISPDFTALFEATDVRRTLWMSDTNFSGVTYSVPFKYKYRTQALAVAANVSEAQVVMRVAEQYLIRAEARARIGTNLTGARDDLNVIRTRAGASVSTSTVQGTLLTEIALENRKELFCEQAFRWFNLKRTGQADIVIGTLKPSYKPTAKLLPFPTAATDANPNLKQNPGYL